ncbi:MAG: hypothetical protein ACE5EM_01320 [Sphingomonadales bacterium]
MAERKRLPDRRPSVNSKAWLRNDQDEETHKLHISVHFDAATGRPGQVDFDAGKAGTEIQAALHEFAAVVSIALQHDATMDDLLKAVTHGDKNGRPVFLGLPAKALAEAHLLASDTNGGLTGTFE